MTASNDVPHWKRYLSPSFLADKVREKGVIWCLKTGLSKVYRRLRWVAGKPYRRLYHFAHQIVGRTSWMIPALGFLLRSATQSEKRILAICDFRTMPYAVGELLYFQEMTLILRLEHNVDKIDIVCLCDPTNPARNDQGITTENYHYHLSALLPLAHVNPHLGSFLLMDSPEALESYVANNLHRYYVFPPATDIVGLRRTYKDYFNRVLRFYAEHGFLPYLSCKPTTIMWAYSFLQQEIRPYLPVVVHLRNRADRVDRNADLESWLGFFMSCKDRFDVKFIVIGTREEIEPRFRCLDNVIFSKDYGTTVEQDCALIQTSLMYMGSCSGIAVMALFNNVPYIVSNFRPGHEDIPYGSQLPWATPLQRLVWEPETTELLIDEFTSLFHHIDTSRWRQEFDRVTRGSSARLKRWSKDIQMPDPILE